MYIEKVVLRAPRRDNDRQICPHARSDISIVIEKLISIPNLSRSAMNFTRCHISPPPPMNKSTLVESTRHNRFRHHSFIAYRTRYKKQNLSNIKTRCCAITHLSPTKLTVNRTIRVLAFPFEIEARTDVSMVAKSPTGTQMTMLAIHEGSKLKSRSRSAATKSFVTDDCVVLLDVVNLEHIFVATQWTTFARQRRGFPKQAGKCSATRSFKCRTVRGASSSKESDVPSTNGRKALVCFRRSLR